MAELTHAGDVIPNLQKLNEVSHQNKSTEKYFDVLPILVVDVAICKEFKAILFSGLLENKGPARWKDYFFLFPLKNF